MWYTDSQQPTDSEVRYLQGELEREREWRQQEQEDRYGEQKERQEELRERYESNRRTAETWPEALRKQASLMAEEAAHWTGELAEDYPDDWFGPGAKACNRALEIWKQVEASKQEKIQELQKQIATVQDEIRLEVARQLASESDRDGWQHVARNIERDEDLNNWLYW